MAGGFVSYFCMQKNYDSKEKCGDDMPKNTGETLYLGLINSELYMCVFIKRAMSNMLKSKMVQGLKIYSSH